MTFASTDLRYSLSSRSFDTPIPYTYLVKKSLPVSFRPLPVAWPHRTHVLPRFYGGSKWRAEVKFRIYITVWPVGGGTLLKMWIFFRFSWISLRGIELWPCGQWSYLWLVELFRMIPLLPVFFPLGNGYLEFEQNVVFNILWPWVMTYDLAVNGFELHSLSPLDWYPTCRYVPIGSWKSLPKISLPVVHCLRKPICPREILCSDLKIENRKFLSLSSPEIQLRTDFCRQNKTNSFPTGR